MFARLWNLCCSLKLAIFLASGATLLLMGGSLLIPFDNRLFGGMDQVVLGRWLSQVAQANPAKTWWFYLATLLMVLFGLNTLCCFIDWLCHLNSRWRKTGEYLLHLGVVLVLGAYLWGNAAGWRHPGLQCQVGALTPLPKWPGHYLRLDSFQPVFNGQGPPLDMISQVTLLSGEEEMLQGEVRINQPLLHGGLVITPVSFGRQPIGFSFTRPNQPPLELQAGSRHNLVGGLSLQVLRFLPDTRRQPDGSIMFRSNELGSPAFELLLRRPDGSSWRGWYFMAQGLPRELLAAGFRHRPAAPRYRSYSSLTVNYDPGAPLAAVGSLLMTIGVLLALFSFYRKRVRRDRPEI